MFDFLKKSTGNRLYEFIVPVTGGVTTSLVSGASDRRVVCYAAAVDEDKAKQLAIKNLQIQRCTVHSGWQSRQVDPKNWASYVRTRWPRSAQMLPTQEEVARIVQQGQCFLGPDDTKSG